MKKLLDKPFKSFVLYALIILVLSIPVYVLVIDYIWVSELDEHNILTLQHTKQQFESKELTHEDIEKINQIWGVIQPGLSIIKSSISDIPKDLIYEVKRINQYDPDLDEDRFRGLKSFIKLNDDLYQINIETNVEELDETFFAISIITCFFFVLLIAGFIVLNRRIAEKSWNPFYQILSKLKSFDLTKDSIIELPTTDIEEFHELNQTIELLVNKNIQSYQLQKSFTENASHELQTPIALLKAKFDLLYQEKELTPAINEIIKSIEKPLSRLTRINKNLILLSRVENHPFENDGELDIKEFATSSLMLFEDYIKAKKLRITCIFDNSIIITTNSFLIETLLNNLLSNAINHTSYGGDVTIKILNKRLIYINSGNVQLNKSQLFQRFSTLATEKVSSGLGLAIIKEICNKYQWIIEYRFDKNNHVFTIDF